MHSLSIAIAALVHDKQNDQSCISHASAVEGTLPSSSADGGADGCTNSDSGADSDDGMDLYGPSGGYASPPARPAAPGHDPPRPPPPRIPSSRLPI